MSSGVAKVVYAFIVPLIVMGPPFPEPEDHRYSASRMRADGEPGWDRVTAQWALGIRFLPQMVLWNQASL